MTGDSQIPSNSDFFRKMADRIERNKDDGFGGACVIVPPHGGGNPIELLIVVPHGGVMDLAQFFATISSRIQTTVEETAAQSAIAQGFGRR